MEQAIVYLRDLLDKEPTSNIPKVCERHNREAILATIERFECHIRLKRNLKLVSESNKPD